MKVYALVKLTVFVDDFTAFMEGRNKELPGFCGEGVEVDEDGGSREGFEAVDHGRRKRG